MANYNHISDFQIALLQKVKNIKDHFFFVIYWCEMISEN